MPADKAKNSRINKYLKNSIAMAVKSGRLTVGKTICSVVINPSKSHAVSVNRKMDMTMIFNRLIVVIPHLSNYTIKRYFHLDIHPVKIIFGWVK
jgi:hypothetical protein